VAGSPSSSPSKRAPEKLRALSDRIERMREEERARIARELHDELGQLLTGIKLDFSAALRRLRDIQAPGDVVDRLQSAAGQIEIGIAMVRRIASDLRPAQLDHQDLGGAIEHEARKVAARSGIPITVSGSVAAAIESDRATATFRIFQEAITNAVRHSGASAITARLSTPGGKRLVLEVRDNGVGVRDDGTNGHLGLIGMRERARALGGDVRISSRPGRGTLVAMTLPLEAAGTPLRRGPQLRTTS
jgi:signal transduction histidine kinase